MYNDYIQNLQDAKINYFKMKQLLQDRPCPMFLSAFDQATRNYAKASLMLDQILGRTFSLLSKSTVKRFPTA